MDFRRRQPIDQSERSHYNLRRATRSLSLQLRRIAGVCRVASLACGVSCDRGWNLTPQGLKTLMCLWDLILALAPAFRVESVSREELSCPGRGRVRSRVLDASVSVKTTLVSGRSGQFYVKNVDVHNYASSLQGEVERKHFKEYFFINCG